MNRLSAHPSACAVTRREASGVRPSKASELPSDAAILRVLEESAGGLRLREIYLLALGRDPKTEQMGSGVKSHLRAQIEGLKKAGRVECGVGGGVWVLASCEGEACSSVSSLT